jgi:hypothetical protein
MRLYLPRPRVSSGVRHTEGTTRDVETRGPLVMPILTFETFVAPPEPVVANDLPPGHLCAPWSPITATLISLRPG